MKKRHDPTSSHSLRASSVNERPMRPGIFRLMMKSAVFRLAFLMFLIIVPICILTMLMSIRAIHMAENQVAGDIQEALDLNRNQLDNYLQNIGRRLYTLSRGSNDYAKLMTARATDEEQTVELMHSYMRLGAVLSDIQSEYTWADQVFVYFPDHDYFLSSKSYQVQEDKEVLLREIERGGQETAGNWLVPEDNPEILLGIFTYKNSYYGAGFQLETLLSQIKLDTSANIAAFASQGQGRLLLTETLTADEADAQAFAAVNLYETDPNVSIGRERYLLLKSESQHSDLALVDLVSRSQLDRTLPGFMRILLIISIIFLASIPVLFLLFYRWLVKPVNILIEAIHYVDRGDLDYRIAEKTGAYEFDLLNHNFNDMLDSVKDLKIHVYEKELEKQDIRLQYLSQQIQPHFILNAMNIIYSYEPEEYDLIQKMVLCLSKYFQFIVNANSPYVKICHEMEHISNYLQIQKIRYGERIGYQVETEDTARDAVMPPLLIQNLVENVIKYALRDDAPMNILVTAAVLCETQDSGPEGVSDLRIVSDEENQGSNRRIRIRIQDTGYGIKEETLELIRRFQETKIRQEGLGVGIQNTIERMELFFGTEAQFEARRWKQNEGTEITLTFPARYTRT